MIYEYHCQNCDFRTDVIKSVKDIDRVEPCNRCQETMERVFCPHAPSISVPNFEAQHNWAFGKVIHNKRELKEELVRHEYETGSKLYEVGNDKMDSVKKPKKSYDDVRLGDLGIHGVD